MMEFPLFVSNYAVPTPDTDEVLRYMGDRRTSPEVRSLVLDSISECEGVLSYRICAAKYEISVKDGVTDLGFASASSRALSASLEGCTHAVVFAATVGLGIDRLIHRYSRISPSRALCMQAIGTERVEALCDAFQHDLGTEEAKKGGSIRPRFSPGYGDLPLSLQKDIFRVLDCQRLMGLTLNDSLLMSPSKSVSAIIGITEEKCR